MGVEKMETLKVNKKGSSRRMVFKIKQKVLELTAYMAQRLSPKDMNLYTPLFPFKKSKNVQAFLMGKTDSDALQQ